jgi:succinyl-diaminopimelate desuccinylase
LSSAEESYVVRLLEKLISIPTVNPPGEHYQDFVTALREELEPLGLNVNIIRVPDDFVEKVYPWAKGYPRFILLARLESGEEGPTLHFNGHYDVVPPGQGWTLDPFTPVVRDGKVYGRGATDMKGGIASVVAAVRELVSEGWRPRKGVLELSFTPDEEVGGVTGVGYMVDEGIAVPDYAIVAEPSTTSKIWIGSRGNLWLNVHIYGKQAHGSAPWLGLNAFEAMVEIAWRLIHEYKPKLEERKTDLPMDDPRAAHPTVTLGGEVEGGAKTNIVPGYYRFSIDRRIIPGEDPDKVEEELKSFIMESAKPLIERGYRVEVEVTAKAPATWIPPDHPFVELVASTVRDVLGINPARTVCIGGLDTRYFQARGVPAITYGPGAQEMAHKPDEYVPISELLNAVKVYKEIVKRILGS